jgi:hypothetical protein
MIELSFQHDLYDVSAVDEAVKVYGAYASIDLARGPSEDVVHVAIGPDHATPGIDEGMISAELANYALGLTIERLSAADASPAQEAPQ